MVVHYLRFSSGSARNVLRLHSRKFSASNAPAKKSNPLYWVVIGSAGLVAASATAEYLYPSSVTGLLPLPFLLKKKSNKVDQYPTKSETKSIETTIPKPQNEEIIYPNIQEPESTDVVATIAPSVEETAEDTKLDEESTLVELDEPEAATECPFELPEIVSEPTECPFEFPETVTEPTEIELPEIVTERTEIQVPEIVSDLTELPEWPTECPFEFPEPASEPTEVSVDLPEPLVEPETVEQANVPDTTATVADETELILEALNNTLDYEPVLSDTVLELLVGKAASREKAVVATISRLENAMAGVVNEVQLALEHHNITSALVSAAKSNAQSVSEATDKETAKAILNKLMESSEAVSVAFGRGEKINASVTDAFRKLSEVIEKAEQFDLKGPVGAARALLGKSRNDYYTSCQIAQEHQVDHALLAHYQRSVVNRKKVLEQELAILRDHFPKQHNQLNQTFDAATNHRAQVDELNTLITYLSNKVGRLERDLEEQQTSELEKLKLVAEAQKLEDARILEERLKAQKEQLRYQYELEQQTEVENAVAAARDESARHAERQSELMRHEMTDRTEQQIRDLHAFWSDEAALRESCVETEYQVKLEQNTALLAGVSEMLEIQSERYAKTLQHRRLLNLSTLIFETINSDEDLDADKLKSSLDTLKSEFKEDPLVSAVTATISDKPPSTSFTQLNDRLGELDGECRKTALVTSQDCGIGSSLLSRAMSLLTIRDETYDTKPEDGGSITFYYLYKARSEMRRNNLELAARYLNQLVGTPRTIVTDWLHDARTLLELRQSASVLLNYAKLKNDT